MADPVFRLEQYRADEVAVKFVEMLKRKIFPFDNDQLFPDAILPEGFKIGSREHALFLFYSCSLDSMRKADNVYSAMREIVSAIDIRDISKMKRKDIKRLLHVHLEDQKLGDLDQTTLWNEPVNEEDTSMGKPVQTLFDNSRALCAEYGGDPRNIQTDDVDETIKRISKFRQFRLGKSSLYMKNMVRFGMWDFDACEIPVKIDRHAIRMSLGLEVVITSEPEIKAKVLEKPLSQTYRSSTSRLKISAVDLDDVMWGVGSKLCMANDKKVCKDSCDVYCHIRPGADRTASYFFPNNETRDASDFLE